MQRTNNEGVAKAWRSNKQAQSSNGNFSTNGKELYSYNKMIGYTSEEGQKVLLDYTSRTGHFISMTTSTKHISPSLRYCDHVINPTHFQNTDKRF